MANLVYNRGKYLAALGHVSTSASLQLMLVTTCYEGLSGLLDKTLVDDGTTTDPKSYELGVSGYARQALGSLASATDDANDHAYIDAADATFTALAAGANVGGAVLYIYSTSGGSLGVQTTSDTGQELVAFYALTATPTNGGNITIQFAASSAGALLKFGSTS